MRKRSGHYRHPDGEANEPRPRGSASANFEPTGVDVGPTRIMSPPKHCLTARAQTLGARGRRPRPQPADSRPPEARRRPSSWSCKRTGSALLHGHHPKNLTPQPGSGRRTPVGGPRIIDVDLSGRGHLGIRPAKTPLCGITEGRGRDAFGVMQIKPVLT